MWISKPDDPELNKVGGFMASVIVRIILESSPGLQKSEQVAIENNGHAEPTGKGEILPDNVHMPEDNRI